MIRVPVCARVSRVCPGSPRCLFTGTMLSSLVDYADSDDDDNLLAPTIVATPPLRSALSMPAFAAAIHRDDDEDEDDEEGAAKKATAPPPPTKPASALPDFEEALSNAETPAFLSVPRRRL